MGFEAFNDSYIIDSMILGFLEDTATGEDGIVRFPKNQHEKVPWVDFPGFSRQECFNAYSMAKQVLISSYEDREKQYREVSITYNPGTDGKIREEDCAVVRGDYDHVDFYNDAGTQALLRSADRMTVVSMHNHPNNSATSIRDMFIFASIPKLHMLEIVHPTGELDICLRHERVPLLGECIRILFAVAPDVRERQAADPGKMRENGTAKDLFDYLTASEKNAVKARFADMFGKNGVSYHEGISEENVKEMEALLQADYAKALERRNELETRKAVETHNIQESALPPGYTGLFQAGEGPGAGKPSYTEQYEAEREKKIDGYMQRTGKEAGGKGQPGREPGKARPGSTGKHGER